MIFLVDPSTETFDDLMRKVDARLNPTGRLTLGMTREGVKIRKHGSGWKFGGSVLVAGVDFASIGIQSGDCAFKIVAIDQSRDFPYSFPYQDSSTSAKFMPCSYSSTNQ